MTCYSSYNTQRWFLSPFFSKLYWDVGISGTSVDAKYILNPSEIRHKRGQTVVSQCGEPRPKTAPVEWPNRGREVNLHNEVPSTWGTCRTFHHAHAVGQPLEETPSGRPNVLFEWGRAKSDPTLRPPAEESPFSTYPTSFHIVSLRISRTF